MSPDKLLVILIIVNQMGSAYIKTLTIESTFLSTYRQSQLRLLELALAILQGNKFSDHDFPELAGFVAKTATFADIQIFQYGLTDANSFEGINHDGKDLVLLLF